MAGPTAPPPSGTSSGGWAGKKETGEEQAARAAGGDTRVGYIVTRVGRVPVRGELIPGPGAFEIEILDADPRRVKRVRIYLRKPALRIAERPPARRPESLSRATSPAEPVEQTEKDDAGSLSGTGDGD